MNRVLLLLLFLFMFSAQTMNLELSLAPGLSVKNAFLYIIFTLLAVQIAVTQQRKLELLSVLGPFSLYLAYAVCMWLVALLIMEYPGYGIRTTLISLKSGPVEDLMILLVFFYGLFGAKEALWILRRLMWIVIAGNVITALDTLSIINLGVIELRDDGRAGGPFGQSNQYGAFMAFCLPIIAALYWTETGIKKLLAGFGLVVSIVAFFLAVSRAGIIGLAVGALLGAIFLRKALPSRVIVRTGLAVAGLAIVALAGLAMTGYTELLADRFGRLEGGGAYATSGRSEIWARLLGVMLEHPLSLVTGFGWWAYQTDLSMGMFRYSPHNTYLNILYDLGAIGLTLFLLISANILRTARTAIGSAGPESRPFLFGVIIGFLSLLVAIAAGELSSPWLYIWAIVGVGMRIAVSAQSKGREITEVEPRVGAHDYPAATVPSR